MAAGSFKKHTTRIVAAALLIPLSLSLQSSAQQSRLEQQIIAPDCSQPGQCDLQPPRIYAINKNGGRPVFLGAYDALYTKTLRIMFGGMTYQLGVHDELTTSNSEWQFDLSQLVSSVEPGGYAFVIEAIGYDGSVEQTVATVIFMRSDVGATPVAPIPGGATDRPSPVGEEDPPIAKPDDRPRPDVPYEKITEVKDSGAVVALLVTGVGLFLLIVAARRLLRKQQ